MIIDQLNEISTPLDSDELPIERGQLTYKIKFGDLVGDITTAIGDLENDVTALQNDVGDLQLDVGDVSTLSGFTATDLTGAANEVNTKINAAIILPTSINIPSDNQSSIFTVTGLTSKHRLIAWNFSSSAENTPPVNLEWETGYNNVENQLRITNQGGTTSESIRPIFVLPTDETAT